MRRKFYRNKGVNKSPDNNKKINIWGLTAIIVGFIALNIAAFQYVSVEKTEQVFGIVTMLNDTTSESGVRQRIIVKLENGETVQAVLPNSLPFRKGSKVKLLKMKTKFLGAEKYKFAGYQN